MQRYLDGDEHFSPLPDLLLMDGGHLQAQATQQQLESMGIHIPILGMVKDDRTATRALVTPEAGELGTSRVRRCLRWWAGCRRRFTASPSPITTKSTVAAP